MGGANCPETPRQKMISMMYLVLTALLALNVSKEVLNAFVIVNNGLEITNRTFNEKNAKVYGDFDKQEMINKGKIQPFNKIAKEVKVLTDEMYKYVHDLKIQLIIDGDGMDPNDIEGAEKKIDDLLTLDSKDNYDKSTLYLLKDGETTSIPGCRANLLKEALNKYKEDLKKALGKAPLDPTTIEQMKSSLGNIGIDTENPKPVDGDPYSKYWETSKFYHNPLVCVITVLSKIQNEIKNAESMVLSELYSKISAEDFKFDKLEAKVVASSNYIVQGADYEADLFVAAYSTTEKPRITVGPSSSFDTITKTFRTPDVTKVDSIVNGMGRYKMRGSALGEKKLTTLIEVKKPGRDGTKPDDYKRYFKEFSYLVAKPSVVVSPTKMNVFYIGVENPVDVSVSGFSADKVMASITGGASIVKKGGNSSEYIVKVSKVGDVSINVSVKDGGKTKGMGSVSFRCKTVPDPVAKVAKLKGGEIQKELLAAQEYVIAEMENFDFQLEYKITGFTVSALVDGFFVSKITTGNRFSDEQKRILQNSRKNQKIYIEDVSARGPDGKTRKLSPIIFNVK